MILDKLDKISAKHFEIAGTAVGFAAAVFTVMQIFTELNSAEPSTLSIPYVVGFLMIFTFWTVYGVRFRRIAIWLTNATAFLLQTVLLAIVLTN
jgi:hypothetical protein